MFEELYYNLENDPAFWEALNEIDPQLLIEATEELAAGARCLQALRQKGDDLQAADRLVLDYVIGSIRRSASRTLTHLDETNFAGAYERHHRRVEDAAVETAQTLVVEHTEVEVFEGLLSHREQNQLVQDVKEKKGRWLWERRGGSNRMRGAAFSRIREFVEGIRNHWLLRPAGLGVAFIAYDIAIVTSTFSDGEIRPDKVIVVAKELTSIPVGLTMITSPFLPKQKG